MLYAHIPFCERLCPYCSFNRFPFKEDTARAYFKALREEMRMTARLGYDFNSMYIGGGTPTVLIDELAATIDLARELFCIKEVSCETNPNHLTPSNINMLQGRVQRLSVGVQSFTDSLLVQMDRYDKYGSAMQILQRLQQIQGVFPSLNVDMIFNFPSQTEEMLINDLAAILESGCNQTTFYPLMASSSVERSLARTVGKVSYSREKHYYEIISEVLAGSAGCANSDSARFAHGTAWTFNAISKNASCAQKSASSCNFSAASDDNSNNNINDDATNGNGDVSSISSSNGGLNATAEDDITQNNMIDEYIVTHEEYPAIGSGGFSYLNGALYINTFSVRDYIKRINEGRMSVVSRKKFSKHDRMRYRLMMQLFGLRLDKKQWEQDFGCSVAVGVPAEYAFFKSLGAFASEDEHAITLSPKGRYLLLALMRQFFIGVNGVRDQARSKLEEDERELLFGC
ncbi:MAG: radical SAM protein [Coriobacteriales bacterium]|jgi:coproporphyrinogen III oxidase-like Fe-S oxidoreductase|nr:radical SAM protein [Coriobacteriales bacterium]